MKTAITAAAVLAIAGTSQAAFTGILNLGYDSAANTASATGSGFYKDATAEFPTNGYATDGVIISAASGGVWNNGFVNNNADAFAASTHIAVDNRNSSAWLFNDGSFLPGGPQITAGPWSVVSTGSFTSGDATIGGAGVGTAIGFGSVGAEQPTGPISVSEGTFTGVYAGRFVVDAGALVGGAVGATTDGQTASFPFPANGRSGAGAVVDRGDGTLIAAYFDLAEGAGPDGRDVIDLYLLEGIPTPGTAAILGLAGLAGARRRR
ncbi:MAG: hypothetical protein AAFX05_00910 [Planctomycetota bacterium]